MTQVSKQKKPLLRQANAKDQIITITIDDHRNHPNFLSKNPGVKVVGKRGPANKKPHQQTSVAASKTIAKSIHIQPSVAKPSPPHPSAGKSPIDNMYDLQAQAEAENDAADLYEDESEPDDSSVQNSFIFHEVAAEAYDPELDSQHYPESGEFAAVVGARSESIPDILMPTSITVDPNSFELQTDAKDGTVSFKASLIFDNIDGINLDDFDIIISQVTPA